MTEQANLPGKFPAKTIYYDNISPLAAFLAPLLIHIVSQYIQGTPSLILNRMPSFKSAIDAGIFTNNECGIFEIYLILYACTNFIAFYVERDAITKNILFRQRNRRPEGTPSMGWYLTGTLFLGLILLLAGIGIPYIPNIPIGRAQGQKYIYFIIGAISLSIYMLSSLVLYFEKKDYVEKT